MREFYETRLASQTRYADRLTPTPGLLDAPHKRERTRVVREQRRFVCFNVEARGFALY